MCTGDNILTGLKVAADCDLIKKNDRMILVEAEAGQSPVFTYPDMSTEIEKDEKKDSPTLSTDPSNYYFACTGKSFEVIRREHPDLLNKIAVRGKVFARMSPDQKQQLVEALQSLGYFVGMCGDGANDCGALKTADSGVSLSEAEASVASPFTSKKQNISCVPLVIGEGRAALVTSFGLVKFIVMYSLTQFFSVLILYTINAGLTDLEFLYIDLCLATLLSFLMSRTHPYPELYLKPPPNRLIHWRPIVSIIVQGVLMLGVQVFVFFYVKMQPWYEAYEDSTNKDEKDFTSYENAAVFMVSMFQYVGESIVYSKGAPFRRSILSNFLLVLAYAALIAFNLILSLAPLQPLLDFFSVQFIKDVRFKIVIIGIALAHFFLAFIIESYFLDPDPIVNYDVKEEKLKAPTKKSKKKLNHNDIEYELVKSPNWPAVQLETPIVVSKSEKSAEVEPKRIENGTMDHEDVSKVNIKLRNNKNSANREVSNLRYSSYGEIIEEIDYL
jgi:cation-transporting ATPase 13A3/4/5